MSLCVEGLSQVCLTPIRALWHIRVRSARLRTARLVFGFPRRDPRNSTVHTNSTHGGLSTNTNQTLWLAEHQTNYPKGLSHRTGLFYWGGDWLDYVHAVDYNGEEVPRVPSPVDETYWLGVIVEPALAIANLSLSRPIWGIVWDFELYLYDSSLNAKDYSYDEPALRVFANASGNQDGPGTH